MNKKGFIGGANSFIFGMFGLAVLIFVVAALIPIQQGGVEIDEMLIKLNETQHNTLSNFEISADNSPILNILHSLLNFVFYSTFEVVKLAVNYSVNNPGVINAENVLLLIVISLSIPIVYYAIAFLLLVFLSIKEGIQSSTERRKVRRLEDESKRI